MAVNPFGTSWSYNGGAGQNMAQVAQSQAARLAAAKKKAAQAANPTYAEAPTYLPTAKDLAPAPAKLTDITQNDLYKQMSDITQLPGYAEASAKTVLDPEYYKNKWTEAEGDINKSYMKKGGFYDRMMEGLNERGLGTSGEANFQTREVGSNLATELANAYRGIETERMGNQMNLDEAYAGRMGNLLGTQNTNLGNLLGLVSGRETAQQGTDWNVSQGQATLAQQLTDAYNQLVSGDYDRAATTAQAEAKLEADKLQTLAELGGSGAFEGSDQNDAYDQLLSEVFGVTPSKKRQTYTYPRANSGGVGSFTDWKFGTK